MRSDVAVGCGVLADRDRHSAGGDLLPELPTTKPRDCGSGYGPKISDVTAPVKESGYDHLEAHPGRRCLGRCSQFDGRTGPG